MRYYYIVFTTGRLFSYFKFQHHNFEANQAGMKRQLGELRVILQFMEPQLWEHLDSKDSSNLYFCFRWLLIHFKREFSFEDIQSLWEVGMSPHVISFMVKECLLKFFGLFSREP